MYTPQVLDGLGVAKLKDLYGYRSDAPWDNKNIQDLLATIDARDAKIQSLEGIHNILPKMIDSVAVDQLVEVALEVVPIDPTLGTCKLVPVAGEMDTPGTYKVQLHIEFVDTTETYIQNMFITIVNVLS